MDARNINASLIVRDNYPPVYRMTMDKPDELLQLYEDILEDTKVNDVRIALVNYVTEIIEPIGWRGIWRSNEKTSNLSFQADFEVEVMDVSHKSLEADVVVRKILAPDNLTSEQQLEVDALTKDDKIQTVPLIELYVISEGDEDENFSRTAVVIEHLRFFYRHLWRAWDGITGTNGVFVEGRLQPRLNLYFDMKKKTIPDDMVSNIKKLLAESWQIRQILDDLSEKMENLLESDETADDNEKYLDETHVYEGIRLRMNLESIERELKLLEDPYTRIVASKNKLRKTCNTDSAEKPKTIEETYNSL